MDTAALLGGLWQPPRPTPGPSAPPPMWQLQHAASVQQPAAVAAAAVAAAAAAAAAGAPQLSVQSLLARPGLTQQHLSLLASRSQPQLQKAAAALLLPQLPPPLAPPLPNMAMPPFGFATALSGGFLPILPGAGYPAVQQVDAKSSQHHVDPQAAAALLASLPFPCMPPVVSSVAAAVAAVQAAVAAAADRNGATSAFEAQRPPFVGALADGTGRVSHAAHQPLFRMVALSTAECAQSWQAFTFPLPPGLIIHCTHASERALFVTPCKLPPDQHRRSRHLS